MQKQRAYRITVHYPFQFQVQVYVILAFCQSKANQNTNNSILTFSIILLYVIIER